MLHQVIDRRSLELNLLIAEKITRNPELLRRAYENIQCYVNRPDASYSGKENCLEWKEILDTHSLDEVLEILVQDNDEGQRLRQSSPFTGILTQEERNRIFDKYESFRV